MKLSKLILTTLAAAAVIGFAGCKLDEDDQNAFNGENYSFTEDINKGTYYRSFVTTGTKHFSANATLTINDATNVVTLTSAEKTALGIDSDGNEPVATGVVGFVFGVKKTGKGKYYVKDNDGNFSSSKVSVDVYDFGIVGVRYNKNTSKVQCYVEWEKNVPDVCFGYNKSGDFKGTVYTDKNESSKAENSPWGSSTVIKSTWTDTSLTLDENGKLDVFVRVVAEDDGSYKVSLCDSIGIADSACEEVVISNTVTGLSEKTQLYIGRYISVYPKQSMSGSIIYSNVAGNLIPAEYENIEE